MKTIPILIITLLLTMNQCSNTKQALSIENPIQTNQKENQEIDQETDIENIRLSEFQEKLLEDLDYLCDFLENNSIIFAQKLVQEDYYISKNELYHSLHKIDNYNLFLIRINMMLATLGSLHITAKPRGADSLDFNCEYIDNNLIVTGGNLPTGAKIISIGNKNINEIINFSKKAYPYENKIGEKVNAEQYFKVSYVLEMLGCDIKPDGANVVYEINGKSETEFVNFKFKPLFSYTEKTIGNSYEIKDDIFIFTFALCKPDEGYMKSEEKLKEYISDGGKNIIIDVRYNVGGQPYACENILKILDLEYGQVGREIYVSKYMKEFLVENEDVVNAEIGEIISSESVNIIGEEKYNLIVLTGLNTFSAGMYMPFYVQDAKIGKVIGEISAHAPSFYGGLNSTTLPNSKSTISISSSQTSRPDSNATQDKLIPDYLINDSEDALDVAINLIKNKS